MKRFLMLILVFLMICSFGAVSFSSSPPHLGAISSVFAKNSDISQTTWEVLKYRPYLTLQQEISPDLNRRAVLKEKLAAVIPSYSWHLYRMDIEYKSFRVKDAYLNRVYRSIHYPLKIMHCNFDGACA